jgi:hypothetical protein
MVSDVTGLPFDSVMPGRSFSVQEVKLLLGA